MKLNLPQFNPSAPQRQWVNGEAQTARFIAALWSAGGQKQRDPGFISLLARCAWTNVREDESGWESTRIWHNQNIADYLGVEYVSDAQLAEAMSGAFPRLKRVFVLAALLRPLRAFARGTTQPRCSQESQNDGD